MNLKLSFRILGALVILLILNSGCSKKTTADDYKLVEYLEVKGICFENHARRPDKYVGSLVHWFNKTKNIHNRYGSVSTFGNGRDLVEESLERAKSPYKYFPPFSIEFDAIPESLFILPTFRIQGISSDSSIDETGVNTGYESTCVLQVLKRLDQMPESEDQAKKQN
jgi:hypothetical protein